MTRLLLATMLSLSVGDVAAQGTAPTPPRSLGEARANAARTPVERPAGIQQVAVLTLRFGAGGSAEVERVEVVNAVPPKVFARSRGSWEVRLQGDVPTSYRIPNPFEDIEVEDPGNDRSPFRKVTPDAGTPFTLVVPLSRDGRSLGVQAITIVDTASRRQVLETPLRK